MHLNSKPPTTVYGHPGRAIAQEVDVGLVTVHRIAQRRSKSLAGLPLALIRSGSNIEN
jgi:hypothetical protein